ncbi:hypothetical protein ACQJBY_050346 [Aegilops geniculata]
MEEQPPPLTLAAASAVPSLSPRRHCPFPEQQDPLPSSCQHGPQQTYLHSSSCFVACSSCPVSMASPGSEISGSFSAAKKALLLVSTCLQDNPRPDTSNFPSGRPFGPPGSGVGCPPGVDPHSQRSYLPPPHVPDYHARNFSSNGAAPGPRFFVEQEIMFRMICLNDMVGGVIGKGGSTIRALQSETGASVKVIDPVADSDERIIVISAREDALIRVYSKISEASMDKSSSVPARLLVPAQHIGCLLGKGGSIIAEMRKVTGASIRIFGNEQIPRCAQRNEELVQDHPEERKIEDHLRRIVE